jgi:hypothetical protein
MPDMVKLMHWTVYANRTGQDQKISLDEVDPSRRGLRLNGRRGASLRLLDYSGTLVKAR